MLRSRVASPRVSLIALVLLLALASLAWLEPGRPEDQPGYFQIQQREGTWSFVNSRGTFFSIGINGINPADEEGPGPRYRGLNRHRGDLIGWRAETLDRLRAWNVNTIGAWSSLRGRPYVVELSLSYRWIDVFGEQYVRKAAQDAVQRPDVGVDYAALDRDPLLLGYFTDNELAWGWGHRWSGGKNQLSLFEYYASLAPDAPGKKAWVSYLAETYRGDWQQFSRTWDVDVKQESDLARLQRIAPRRSEDHAEARQVADGFLKRVAERYFAVTDRLMRQRLPHHLNLGTRMTPGFPDVVAEVAGRYVDVLSINLYTRDLAYFRGEVERLHALGGKPVLVGEFSFPAWHNRSGNQNKGYERAEVADDQQRGHCYARCVEMLGELPFVVGCHWFQYYDEPTQGRKDGESCNFGFVDVDDRIYEGLAGAATAANAQVLQRRCGVPGRLSLSPPRCFLPVP
jgi:hypothetical protein